MKGEGYIEFSSFVRQIVKLEKKESKKEAFLLIACSKSKRVNGKNFGKIKPSIPIGYQ